MKAKSPILTFPPNSAVLIFDRSEQSYELDCAMKATAMASILWDMDQWLRSKIRHDHTFKTIDEALEACRTELNDNMSGEGVQDIINQ